MVRNCGDSFLVSLRGFEDRAKLLGNGAKTPRRLGMAGKTDVPHAPPERRQHGARLVATVEHRLEGEPRVLRLEPLDDFLEPAGPGRRAGARNADEARHATR